MRVDPLRFAVLFPTLWVAHAVGDHVVQTDWQSTNKPRSWDAMARHVGGYQVTQAVTVAGTLAATGLRCSTIGLAAGTVFSALSHAFLDRRWPVTRLLDATGSRHFARPEVRTSFDVDSWGRVPTHGVPSSAATTGPLPLHGPYLADQALHTACLLVSAALMAVRQ